MARLTPEEFVEKIRDDVDEGYRFVAVVGAGLSVPSGFPQVSDLESRHLRYWIVRALRLNPLSLDDNDLEECRLPPWDPRSGDWPAMSTEVADLWSSHEDSAPLKYVHPNKDQLDGVLHRALAVLRKYSATARARISKEIGHPSAGSAEEAPPERRLPWLNEKLVAQALGHSQDWRMALSFLSRLVWRDATEAEHGQSNIRELPELRAPDRAVIDSCFRFLLRGRDPSLGHQMLVSLCPVLRINTIISTNFDDLIERAFDAIPSPLAVFEVPEPLPLPSASLVCNQRSLIKMNGGVFGLRADSTIDESDPREADTFVDYILGRTETRDLSTEKLFDKLKEEKVAILVSGVAGGERRTTELFSRALDTLKKVHIYWVGFNSGDETPLNGFRYQNGKEKPEPGAAEPENPERRFIHLAHRNHGLLFLQIYQACARSVPSTGVLFPGLWQVPSPPLIPPPDKEDQLLYMGELASRLCQSLQAQLTSLQAGPVIMHSEDKHRGAMTVCARIFEDGMLKCPEKLGGDPRCVWIDLEQVGRPVGLFLRLVQLASRQVGESDPASALDYPAFELDRRDARNQADYKYFCSALKRVLRGYHAQLGRRLVVFINTNEGAGTFPPLYLGKVDEPHSELLSDQRWEDPTEISKLVALVENINRDPSCGVQFVFLTREKMRRREQETTVRELLGALRESAAWPARIFIARPCTEFDEHDICDKAIAWAHRGTPHQTWRMSFLYLLIVYRHVRYPAGLFRSEARDHERDAARIPWPQRHPNSLPAPDSAPAPHLPLAELEKFAGEIETALKDLAGLHVLRWQIGGLVWMSSSLKLELRDRIAEEYQFNSAWPARALFLEGLVGRWCGRLLLSSADPLAAVESIYHAVHGTWVFATKVTPQGDRAGWNQARVMLEHARLILNVAKPLFERKVSEQFSDAALTALQCWVEGALECFSKQSVSPSVLRSLEDLFWEIAHVRSTTYLNEAQFEKVAEVTTLVRQPSSAEHRDHQKGIRLDAAAALLFQRRHAAAETELHELWLDRFPRFFATVPGETAAAYFQRLWNEYPNGTGAVHAILEVDDPSQKARRFGVGLARWLSFWHLNDSQIRFLHDSDVILDDDAPDERIQALERALWFADFGLELLRTVPDTSDGAVYEDNVLLRANAALCHAYIANLTGRHTGQHLMRRPLMLLADASAYVDEFPFRDACVGRAIVNLRRAEVHLVSVHANQWFAKLRQAVYSLRPERSQDAILTQLISGILAGEGRKEAVKALREAHPDMMVAPDQVAQVLGLLDDVLMRLDRAEAELQQHPKSRWWWWILCVLKTRLGEYLHVVRLASMFDHQSLPPVRIPLRVSRYCRSEIFSDVGTKLIRDPLRLARIIACLEGVLLTEILHFNIECISTTGRRDHIAPFVQSRDRLRDLCERADQAAKAARNEAEPVITRGLIPYVEECCSRGKKLAEHLDILGK